MTVKDLFRHPAGKTAADAGFEMRAPASGRHCLSFGLQSATGLPYDIFVSLPRHPPPPQGFPVLYLLDANADFALVDQVMERLTRRPGATGVEPSILVGIGYPETESYNQERRHFDFTAGPTRDAFYAETTFSFGGQDAFVAFLRNKLKPLIAARFPVRTDQETILGHSLGGYFVVELALTHPQLFSSYIAISPSLWWDPDRIFAHALPHPAKPHKPVRLFLTAGGWEGDAAPWQRQETPERAEEHARLRRRRQMVRNIDRLAEHCQARHPDAIALRREMIDDEDHSSIYVASLPKALRFALPASDS
ncbi:alpha/beta hydrolase-fold protein [Martelella sp. HB161492]|uniref:alpha/beta hydrolase n=1 Tax=Martelella sp. HB161492 TaxID=2720726 RepID=UPI001592717C|nr:alpha/beta hydrolase-fold protein [Martelella sp. HB161492]